MESAEQARGRRLRSEPAVREAVDIIRRYPLATIGPAILLGVVVQATHLLHGDRWFGSALVAVVGIFAFALYVAYIEEVALEAEAGIERISVRDTRRLLRRTLPVLFAVALATSITAVFVSLGTLGAIFGVWLLTRWSLAVPVIARRRVGAIEALKRSNLLVRGCFWPVFLTATVAILLEEGSTSLVPALLDPLTGQAGWGRWLVGSVLTSLVMPLTGLVVSVSYNRRIEEQEPHLF
jgi:hypothetical protein